MNVATYVYIVHSDINENNIYAEFATEEEAIDYARRHKDELTYVDKVDAALDEDGEIIEIFDERTIWVYDEDEEEDEEDEEINEFDTDFEDDEEEQWSVCVVTPDDGDSDLEHFDSESEAREYFNNYTSYESGREVEVQLYGPDGMEDSYTIGADEEDDFELKEETNELDIAFDEDEEELQQEPQLKQNWQQHVNKEIDKAIEEILKFKQEDFIIANFYTDEVDKLYDYLQAKKLGAELIKVSDYNKLSSVEQRKIFNKMLTNGSFTIFISTEEDQLLPPIRRVAQVITTITYTDPMVDEGIINEGINLKNKEEQDEFFRLCDEIGIYTAKDLINFKKEVDCTDENILQALRDYRAELGPDFKIANPELERELAMKYEGIDFDKLVEELEEFEDEVECRECYGLFPKESCIKGEHGYVCEKCSKTLTESISELTPEQLAEMDAYLRSGKDLSLDDFEEEHDFGIDLVGGELTYNSKTNDFTFYLSIYHASEDNNAEYPEYHTDEEEISFDTIEEIYDEYPQYLEDMYKWHAGEFSKLEEAAKCKDCGGELKDNKCTSCNRDFNLTKCKHCGGEVKDGKCMHCDTKVDMVKCQYCGGEVVDNKCTSCNEIFEEAIKMTRDELMNKEGTDDVELINAGRPEEERVELIEDGLDPHTVIARVERWLENKDRPLYIFNGPKTLEEITNYLESKEISYRVVDAKDGYVESNGDIIIYVANESRQYIPELWEDPAIMLTPTYGHNVVSAYDFNTKESCWALDQLVRKMFKKFNGISADALRQLHKTYKHMSNTALGKTFADCETLSDVVDKLDPYFDFAMTKSLYHRDVESYDKIINDLPDAIWEVLNK